MAVTKKTFDHLAKLARLSFSDAEATRFTKDLNAILKHFKELDSVNTEHIDPMIGTPGMKNIFRTDAVSIAGEAETVDEEGHIIGAFPESSDGHLKVPKIL